MNSTAAITACLLLFVVPCRAETPEELSTEELLSTAQQYEFGEGQNKNLNQAIIHYCHAARRGSERAAYQLGWIYFNGRGVRLDDQMAANWFAVAANMGDKLASKHLQRLPSADDAVEPDCILADGSTYLEPIKSEPSPDPEKITYWVGRLARDYELHPALVLAVIEAESNFQVRAKSHKNAMGLMQLIPDTAKRFNVEDVWDPLQNIQGGMAYLQWLQQHFDRELDYVLAAYNAGENVVKRYNGIPPYKETRHYVKKVKRLYQRNLNNNTEPDSNSLN